MLVISFLYENKRSDCYSFRCIRLLSLATAEVMLLPQRLSYQNDLKTKDSREHIMASKSRAAAAGFSLSVQYLRNLR
jgi:hypothetical protein